MKKSTVDDRIILFPGVTSSQVEEAATKWVIRCHSGECTPGDLVELAMWRAASPANDRIYTEIDRLWQSMGAVARPGSALSTVLHRVGRATRVGWLADLAPGKALLAAKITAIAASVVGLSLADGYWTTWRYDYHTAPGEIRSVVLADGSTASLKGDTAFSVRFTERGERVVDLAKGEAFFEVVHDPSRPFVVDAGAGRVLDIGTGFSVARDGQSGSVSVDHGQVELVAAGGTQRLGRGEAASFGVYELGRKTYVDTQYSTAWRRGMYFAQAKPLGQVIAEVNPYLPGKIVVVSGDLQARPINAVVQLAKVDAWLDVLGNVHGISVRKLGPLIVISTRK